MLNGNLLKLLSALSESEFRKFGKFVNSPYFNANAKLILLYDHLSDFYPDFDSLELSRQNIFRKIYKEDRYVEGTMFYLISEMEKLVCSFISQEKINTLSFDLALLEDLSKKRIDSLFEKKYRSFLKKLDSSNDSDNFFRYCSSVIYSSHLDNQKNQLTKKDVFREEWFNPLSELIKYFLKRILTQILLLTNYNRTLNEKLEIPFVRKIMDLIESESKYLEQPDIKIIYHLIRIHIYNDEKSYFTAKEFLIKNGKKLSKVQISEIINSLLIFCFNNMMNGKSNYSEQFEIAKLRIKFNQLVVNNIIRIDAFYNLFMMAVSLEEFDWAQDFLKKYSINLEQKFRNNAVHYGNARIFFYKKEYGEALKELSKIKNFSFIHYKPAVKILQMMIYYELKLLPECTDAANSFIQFLRNDKLVHTDYKKVYDRFIKIYLKLVNVESSKKMSKLNDLSQTVKNLKEMLISRKWITAKIDELEKRMKNSQTKQAI